MTPTYWPWWVGALALASIAVGHWILAGRLLGVSGALSKLVNARAERRAARMEASAPSDARALEAALLAATAEEFAGMEQIETAPSQPPEPPNDVVAPSPLAVAVGRAPWMSHLLFLVMIGVGGTVARVVGTGTWSLETRVGPLFEGFWGLGWTGGVALLIGGACVGLGTRLAGGCCSGHALSGVATFQVRSVIATIAFFGTAVITSLALHHLL